MLRKKVEDKMVQMEVDEATGARGEFRFAADKMMETSKVALFAASGGYRPVVDAILKAAKRGEDKAVVDVSNMSDDIRRSLMETLTGMGLQAGGGTVFSLGVTHNIHISGITSWYDNLGH